MKRLLALDGGGLRGIFSLAILERMEILLKEKYGDSYKLTDHFHYLGGTSTGAIISALLSWGYSASEIVERYQKMGNEMFEANFVWKFLGEKVSAVALTGAKFKSDKIGETLRDFFQEEDGTDALLSSPNLKSKLLIVTQNARTGSTWPITNNPYAKYNTEPEKNLWSNLNFPLWKIIRASTAAPTYFPPEELTIHSKDAKQSPFVCAFQDGGVSPYNNPAYLLYLKATLPEYNTQWKTGEDHLHLVSIGTGYVNLGSGQSNAEKVTELLSAIPSRLIQSNQKHQDLMCRVNGRCLFGAPIDSELGDLIRPNTPQESSKFTYARYNQLFEYIKEDSHLLVDSEIPFPYPELINQKLPMEKVEVMLPLLDFGRQYAKKFVQLDDLR